MTVKKGSRVKFKAGKGYGLGKVTSVKGGVATIATEGGASVNRKLEGLKHPDDKEEPASPKGLPTNLVTPDGQDELYISPNPLLAIDEDDDSDEFDSELEFDPEGGGDE